MEILQLMTTVSVVKRKMETNQIKSQRKILRLPRILILHDQVLGDDVVYLAPFITRQTRSGIRIKEFSDVSKVVLFDLLVLRPFIIAMLRQWDIEAADDVRNFFFANSKGRLSDAALTRQFVKVVNAVTDIPLLFSEFRQFVKFVVNRFIGGVPF